MRLNRSNDRLAGDLRLFWPEKVMKCEGTSTLTAGSVYTLCIFL